MQLRVSIFLALLLFSGKNFFADPCSTLYAEIEYRGTVFYRQSNFLTPHTSAILLSQEDKVIIKKIIDLYQVSHNTLVDLTCSNDVIAQGGYHIIPNDTEAPYISLSPYWQKLPYEHKEFILAHEIAHVVLGHCKIFNDEHIDTMIKIHGNRATEAFFITNFYGLLGTLYSLHFNKDIITPPVRALMYSLTGMFTSMCLIGCTIFKHNQTKEKEADIKAVTMLGNARGGIAWLRHSANQENNILDNYNNYMKDTFLLSAYPSYYARLYHLHEWQIMQKINKGS